MTGANEEGIAAAMNSSATPPAGLTRREIREWERSQQNQTMSVEDQLALEIERQLSNLPTPVSEEFSQQFTEQTVPLTQQAPVFLSRREMRVAETSGIHIIPEHINGDVQSVPAAKSLEVTVPSELPDSTADLESTSEVPVATPAEDENLFKVAGEQESDPVDSEGSIPHAVEGSTRVRPPLVYRRVSNTEPRSKTVKSKRNLRNRTQRRRISQMMYSAGALIVCFAFALSVSIPANALLTQNDVEHIKMQTFLDEQVALASQSVSISNDSGKANLASRDGVDVSLATKSVAVTSYGSSGLCGPETAANPPSSSSPIQWPLASVKISSPYGARWGTLHAGTDFDPGFGVPILAAADGIVIAAFPSANNSLGICAIISHNVNGVRFDTLYGHMSQMFVSVGQTIHVGDQVGLVGSTGNSTGPHLHFEVHVNGVQIDPEPFMRNYAGAPPA